MGAWGPARDQEHVPLDWWGPFGASGPALTVVDLVAGGVVTADQAARLWTAVERGESVCVAAGPSGAGKTTTLTSLIDAIPPGRRRVYPRGMYETFAFRRELGPGEAALLVNEISPHLPIYCWGDAVRGLLQCARDGYQVLATIHAVSAKDLVPSLAARPLRLPPALIAKLGIVAFLDAWREADGRIVRRVREIVRLTHDPAINAISATPVAGQAEGDALVWRRSEAIARLAATSERPSPRQLRAALSAIG